VDVSYCSTLVVVIIIAVAVVVVVVVVAVVAVVAVAVVVVVVAVVVVITVDYNTLLHNTVLSYVGCSCGIDNEWCWCVKTNIKKEKNRKDQITRSQNTWMYVSCCC